MSENIAPKFEDVAARFLENRLSLQHVHDALPLPPDESGDPASPTDHDREISTHALVLPLEEEEDWSRLNDRFARNRRDNLKPWFRCIGLLRGLGARSAVVETYYVCLDYKSEHAAFYAHLDAPLNGWTVRLHFFDEVLTDDDVVDLHSEEDRDLGKSYLGYIVCREGDLPLVGRCLIKLPSYLEDPKYSPTSTAITEPVNFFGQRLEVMGVPFMQQDQRFANCAHVAMWTIHYSAYRRGVMERRLVADIVGLTGGILPLRPRASDGLSETQVAGLLTELGFRTTTVATPTLESDFSTLPRTEAIELPELLRAHLIDSLSMDPHDRSLDVTNYVTQALRAYVTTPAPTEKDAEADHGGVDETVADPDHPTVRALHGLLDYLVTPSIESGWPVYCATADHALVLCGRATIDGRPVHFVHDDQCGPYLLTDSLPTLSQDGLRYQSGFPQQMGSSEFEATPPVDRVLENLKEFGTEERLADLRNTEEMTHAVVALVFPMPARVLLPASVANRKALTLATNFRDELLASELDLDEEDKDSLFSPHHSRTSIVMGIDYKQGRRKEAIAAGDRDAVVAFSSVQLAEWVVVVEGIHAQTNGSTGVAEEQVHWEFVYDASSSEVASRLQLVRILGVISTAFPRSEKQIEVTRTKKHAYGPLRIPSRVAKVAE